MSLLTKAEWLEVKPPFVSVRAYHSTWGGFERSIIHKWLDVHLGGWFYYGGSLDADTYIFERSGDAFMFQLWISGNPFKGEAQYDFTGQ